MRSNRNRRKIVASGVSLALLLFSPMLAKAADQCANVGGTGGCFASIQDAIDAASAGDKVTIKKGVYFQKFTVPVTSAPGGAKDGLTVKGADKKKVIIDPDDPNSGVGIEVFADDVTLEKFTVRNGTAVGIQVDAGATGTRIEKLKLTGQNGDCINIDGDDTVVDDVKIFGCGSTGIEADADDVTIQKSDIRNCDSGCIDVFGDRAVIDKNDVAVSEDSGCIEVRGDDAVVTKNDTRACSDGSGVEVRGDNAHVGNNFVTAANSRGIDVFGANPVVYHNTVKSVGEHSGGFEIDCTPCTGGSVTDNKAIDIPDDSEGFDIFAAAPGGLLVEDNLAERANDEGFNISGTGIVLRKNEAKDNGGDRGESGFQIRGTGHTVVGNESRRNHDDGFDIRGRGHIVYHNVAKENREDGFDVRADTGFAIALTDNEAEDNNATGFEVNGTGVVTLTDNASDNNRQAFCDSGGATVDGGGNDFAVPGGVVACDDID